MTQEILEILKKIAIALEDVNDRINDSEQVIGNNKFRFTNINEIKDDIDKLAKN